MALTIPGLKAFSNADSKSRIFILFVGVVGIAMLIYFAFYFYGTETATGPSRVASAPAGFQSVPGGQLTPEYYRTLAQANAQAVQQAQVSGGSAQPTLINLQNQSDNQPNCTVLCPSDDNANVGDDINALIRDGKLSKEDGARLMNLSNRNASVAEYAAALDELVRQGKLTPEQARLLLEKYKKQHANVLLKEAAASMDGLIKSGQLPLGIANDLLELQKKHLTPAEYAAELERLVKEGKLSPQAAAQLLAQYTQQYAREQAKDGAFAIHQMAKSGQLTPDVAKQLLNLQSKNIPLNQYEAELNRLVSQGKMTPATAMKLLQQYRQQRMSIGATGLLGDMLAKGGASAEEAKKLLAMQANNASLADYTEELKRAVQSGVLSPDQAASLLQQYLAMVTTTTTTGASPTIDTNIPGAEAFAQLQQRVQQQAATATPTQSSSSTEQFQTAVTQAQAQTEEQRQQRIQQLQSAMSTQAQGLLTAWQPPTLKHMAGSADDMKSSQSKNSPLSIDSTKATATSKQAKQKGSTIIKSGTIYFAVLDTAVDSDYPDTPVMATIVQGPYKGAKLLGKLNLAQGQDRVSLNFTQMDKDDWADTLTISAYAIDPDTARTVLASQVDHHYLMRYGAMMASSFISGYSSAITQAGNSTTGIFGTSTTHPELSPGNKIAVGIGQIGTNLATITQGYVNTPTTVKVNSGVGLGILFVSSVTNDQSASTTAEINTEANK